MNTTWRHRLASAGVTAAVFLIFGSVYVTVRVGNEREKAQHAQLQSDQNLCNAINDVVNGGFGKVVGALQDQTRTSKQRSEQEKLATLSFYQFVLDSFPKLDCKANPIVVERHTTAATTTTVLP